MATRNGAFKLWPGNVYVHIIAQYNGLVSSFLNLPFYWIPFAPTLLMFVLFQLGANAILSVSLAVCKAGAGVKKIPLYQVGSHSLLTCPLGATNSLLHGMCWF